MGNRIKRKPNERLSTERVESRRERFSLLDSPPPPSIRKAPCSRSLARLHINQTAPGQPSRRQTEHPRWLKRLLLHTRDLNVQTLLTASSFHSFGCHSLLRAPPKMQAPPSSQRCLTAQSIRFPITPKPHPLAKNHWLSVTRSPPRLFPVVAHLGKVTARYETNFPLPGLYPLTATASAQRPPKQLSNAHALAPPPPSQLHRAGVRRAHLLTIFLNRSFGGYISKRMRICTNTPHRVRLPGRKFYT